MFQALDVHGCSAITALTAQNPDNILHIQPSSIAQFSAELQAITDYYDVKCIKTGMLYDQAHVDALLPFLHDKQVVIDPVLIASSGKILFDEATAKVAYETLLPYTTLWTPNLDEAAFFLGKTIDDAVEAASALVLVYQTPVLLKGGHGHDKVLHDIYCDTAGNIEIYTHQKLDLSTSQTHGTGCRLASAIAAHLAQGHDLHNAIEDANRWLQSDLNT